MVAVRGRERRSVSREMLACAHTEYNTEDEEAHAGESLSTFKKLLKTQLFREHLPS